MSKHFLIMGMCSLDTRSRRSGGRVVTFSFVRARVVVEAAHPDFWYRFVGLDGEVVGIRRYGVSAPGEQALAHLGVTVENVVQAVKRVLI